MCQSQRSGKHTEEWIKAWDRWRASPRLQQPDPLLHPSCCPAPSEHAGPTTCSGTSGDRPRLMPTHRIASAEVQVYLSLQTVAGTSTPELLGLRELAGGFLPDFWHWERGSASSRRGRGICHHVPRAPRCGVHAGGLIQALCTLAVSGKRCRSRGKLGK